MFKLFFFVLVAIICAVSAKPKPLVATYSSPYVAAPVYSSGAYAAYTAPVAAAYTSPYAAYTAPFGYAAPYAAYTALI